MFRIGGNGSNGKRLVTASRTAREIMVVVITGASAGVGRATAREFARPGTKIALLARGRERLEEARREIEERGAEAIVVPTDVADPAQVEAAAETAERELGPIDVWINNAMTTVFSPFIEITPEEFQRATAVTYLGTVYGTLAALKRMRPRDEGVIVQVGSALAYRGIPLQSPYCGAKHAVRGFTDSLRCELLHEKSGIHLTMVQLPGLNTPQFEWCQTRLPKHPQPVAPVYQPEVAARAIVWAAKHRRREVNVGRSAVITIWANKLFPGLGDRYLARTGIEGQQIDDRPISPDRPANLFEPVPGEFAAHGVFDEKAIEFSRQWWLTTHRWAVWLSVAALAGGIVCWFVR